MKSVQILSEYRKIRTEIAPYLDTFHAVLGSQSQLPVIDETREKNPVKANSIIVKNGGNKQMACYAPEISKFLRCYDYTE